MAEIPSFACHDVIDTEAVRCAARRLAAAGFTTIAVAGIFGEYNQLTVKEQQLLISAAMEGAGKNAVCAGAFDAGTEKAADIIAAHAAAGCHTHMCLPNFYFSNNAPGEITRHFAALMEADPEGSFIICDSRAHAGFSIPEDLLLSLKAPVFFCEPAAARAELFSGEIPLLVREELALTGASDKPFVSCLASVFPKLIRHINDLTPQTRRALLTILTAHRQPEAGVKYAAQRLGMCASCELLPPVSGLDAAQCRLLDSAIETARREEERYGE